MGAQHGRPSKGRRDAILAKSPVEYGAILQKNADAEGLYYGEYLVMLAADALGLRELGVLSPGDRVELAVAANAKAARILLVAGRPLKEPVARYGPFVMNTPEQVVQAMRDYQTGRF